MFAFSPESIVVTLSSYILRLLKLNRNGSIPSTSSFDAFHICISFIKFVSLAQKQYTLKGIQEINATDYLQFSILPKRLCPMTPNFKKNVMVHIDTKYLIHLFILTKHKIMTVPFWTQY